MRERLRRLYGLELGDRTADELEALLKRFPRRPGERGFFDQRDALVITYGDSIVEPGRRPLEVLEEFASRHLSPLVSGLHILPFFPYSSDYGFSVVDYLRVNPELGDWNDIESLGTRFRLMFDFVLNHVSVESPWFLAFLRGERPFTDFFISVDPSADLSQVVRPRTTPLLTRFETAAGERWVWTTFGPDQADLNYANPQVLLAMLEVMLTYVRQGAGLLRLDAVGYLWKEIGTSCIHLPQTHEVVKLLRDVLDRVAPEVVLVTETNVPHADNVAYFGDGRDEAQMVYQFPLAPLVLDAFLRGDATRLSAWAKTLQAPSPETTFFNFLASHDGIGVVPATGILSREEVAALADRVLAQGGEVSYKTDAGGGEAPYELNATFFDALNAPGDDFESARDRFLCSQAIMLAMAGVPGIYVHSLFGSRNDQAGYERTGWKRDLNHEHLQLAEVERDLEDAGSARAQIFAGYARLLRRRREEPAFHPNAPQEVLDLGPAVFGLLRGDRVLTLHNVTGVEQEVRLGDQIQRLRPYQALWLKVN